MSGRYTAGRKRVAHTVRRVGHAVVAAMARRIAGTGEGYHKKRRTYRKRRIAF